MSEGIKKGLHKVLWVKHISSSTFIIGLERNGIKFKAGQHVSVGFPNAGYTREYSVYSGENDDYIEILVKEVLDGFISPLLKNVNTGDTLIMEGPLGYFSLPQNRTENDHFLFVATGTGISPFHCFVKSFPGLNYTLIHGVKYVKDACEIEFYDKNRFVLCSSGENTDKYYNGRVTKILVTWPLYNFSRVFLCGNVNMINDVYYILKSRDFKLDKIHSEVYF